MIKLEKDYGKKVREFKGDMLAKSANEVQIQVSQYSDKYDSENFLDILDTCRSWLQSQGLWNTPQSSRTVQVLDDYGNELDTITVTAPETWSDQSVHIFANKYMYREPYYGVNNNRHERETSVRQTFERVCEFLVACIPSNKSELNSFQTREYYEVLINLLEAQVCCFNSPVLFNCGIYPIESISGIPEVADSTIRPIGFQTTPIESKENVLQVRPQTSACFILPVEDSIESIMDLAKTQAMLFKYGSGAGVDLSPLRSSQSSLSGGGKPSGPVSFMQVYDAVAGTIKSGGKTRRAALMMCLDANHGDIDEFINCKSNAEDIVRKLVANGMDPQEAYNLMPYQNMNISVKVTKKNIEDDDFMAKVATAAWNCADPGLLFADTINADNPVESYGAINSTNPCGEFVSPDNTACNLASINLGKFLSRDGKELLFDFRTLFSVVRVLFYAQDSLIDYSSYPNEEIEENSKFLRPIGLGVSNLASVFMRCGYEYGDSKSVALTENILSVIQTACLCESATPRGNKSSLCERFNKQNICLDVDKRWKMETDKIFLIDDIREDAVGLKIRDNIYALVNHIRNSQFTLCAPTGTISFVMGCDTTGIEPEMALRKYKHLIGGGTLTMVNDSVRESLQALDDYSTEEIDTIIEYIKEHGNVDQCDTLKDIHKDVFTCAMNPDKGGKTLDVANHLAIMKASQAHISGAISKTVNLPETSTVQDIVNVYRLAYQSGLKGITIYRDGCKSFQPVTTKLHKDETQTSTPVNKNNIVALELSRRRMPETRDSITHKIRLGDVAGYITVGKFEDGQPGEIFITMDKEGSALGGLANCFSIAVSMGLQYGIPLKTFVKKFKNQTFGPSGWSNSGYHSSVVDYVFRFLEKEFLKNEKISIDNDKKSGIIYGTNNQSTGTCKRCGGTLQKAGSCSVCVDCGETTGCS